MSRREQDPTGQKLERIKEKLKTVFARIDEQSEEILKLRQQNEDLLERVNKYEGVGLQSHALKKKLKQQMRKQNQKAVRIVLDRIIKNSSWITIEPKEGLEMIRAHQTLPTPELGEGSYGQGRFLGIS